MTIVPNQWYDYKVLYDRISGKMDVYQNNVFIGSWTDPTPLANGNAISFRSGDCDYMINDLKVYRSRAASVTVTVGAAATNDVRHENASPAQASCRVKSITKDAAGNLSSIAFQDVNIDWTAPSAPLVVDGTSTDIDTSYSLTSLSGNWSVCVDTNSNVVKYWYSIGTTAGATDVLNWTNNNLNTGITQNGLSLTSNQLYYMNVRSENGAGILSSISSSDGQLVLTPTSVAEINESLNILLYPNPASESATLQYSNPNGEAVDIRLMDALGKEIRLISQENQAKGNQTFIIHKNQLNLASGMYVVSVRIGNSTSFVKLMME